MTRRKVWHRVAVFSAALTAGTACSSSPKPAPTTAEPVAAEPPNDEDPKADVAAPQATPSDSAETTAEPAEDATDAASEPKTGEPQRQVLYRLTPDGLVIEVDGVRFEPKVEPIQKKSGWGVRVNVKASSTDGRMHRLLSPEAGPLAFSARVEKRGKQVAKHDDVRKGDEEQFVPPGDSLDFSREFPGEKEAPLWGGQSLELHVGLWGLGSDADRRRPVRKLFIVKMVTGNAKPQPVITAPQ